MKQQFVFATVWVLLAPLLLIGPVLADQTSRQITVSGEGQVAVVPDMATINLGVTFEAKNAGQAMNATSKATAAMLQRLGELGIEPRDMQTSSLSLNPVWSDRNASDTDTRVITGFVASNSVHVRLRDLSALGRIMDAIIDNGANRFNGLRFSVQDPDPLLSEARQQAVGDAIAKARLLTEAAGVTLGRVLSIAENGGGRPVQMEMSAARRSGVPIAAGEVTVSALVSMVFAIEN